VHTLVCPLSLYLHVSYWWHAGRHLLLSQISMEDSPFSAFGTYWRPKVGELLDRKMRGRDVGMERRKSQSFEIE